MSLEEYREKHKEVVLNQKVGIYKSKEEYVQAHSDVWEKYLVDRFKETRSIEDRDDLINFYFTEYEKKYAKIRNKLIVKEITKEEYLTQIEQMIINGFQIGVDLGFARQITEIECENLINALTNGFDQVNTSEGEITNEIVKDLCNVQIPLFEIFRIHYNENILLKENDK